MFGGFGGTATANPPASSGGGFTFGGQAATTAPSSAPFGGFGAQQPATSTATTGATTGGFGFGAQQQPATSTATTGGFGFGGQPATSTATTGGFGFGAQQQPATSTATTGGFGFGGQPAATTSTAQPSTGLFGAATGPTTGGFGAQQQPATSTATAGGLFGAKPATGGFGFGAQQQQPATSTATTGGLFGAKPATGGFGFGAQQQPAASTATAGGLFGAQQATAGSTFGFGATNAAARPAPTANLASSALLGSTATPTAQEQLEALKTDWDTTSPLCQLQHYLYNLVHPSEVNLYQCPPNQNETLWRQAQRDNPDPSCLVPVLAVGFGDLEKRLEQQRIQTVAHDAKLKEVRKKLEDLQQTHDLNTASKLAEFRRRQLVLMQRVLDIMRKIHLLRSHGRSLRPEEEVLRGRLERLQQRLMRPGQYRARLQELTVLLERTVEHRRLEGSMTWGVPDDNRLARTQRALEEQQRGIAHLIDVLESDSRDVDIMEHGHNISRVD